MSNFRTLEDLNKKEVSIFLHVLGASANIWDCFRKKKESAMSTSQEDWTSEGRPFNMFPRGPSDLKFLWHRGGSGLSVVGPPTAGSANLFDRLAQRAQQQQQEGQAASGGEVTSIEVVFYRNGFTVDGGSLRDLNAPENREFLRAMEVGEVPRGEFLFPHFAWFLTFMA